MRETMHTKEKIIVALDDITERDTLLAFAKELAPYVGMFKIGNAIDVFGTDMVRALADIAPVMVDTKLYDIPNTVRVRLHAYADAGATFATLHTSGGRAMLESAETYARTTSMKLIGVTILTSFSDADTEEIYHVSTKEKIRECADLAAACGLYGIVASAEDLPLLHTPHDTKMKKLTPGIRPLWAAKNDQHRITTPRAALDAGADYLIIGRPIRTPPEEIGSPAQAIQKIIEELET